MAVQKRSLPAVLGAAVHQACIVVDHGLSQSSCCRNLPALICEAFFLLGSHTGPWKIQNYRCSPSTATCIGIGRATITNMGDAYLGAVLLLRAPCVTCTLKLYSSFGQGGLRTKNYTWLRAAWPNLNTRSSTSSFVLRLGFVSFGRYDAKEKAAFHKGR